MTLKQIFVKNLKEFRKKEGLSQMKLAERCNTSPSYIGEIEIGRKFPSMELIEKIAEILRIEPYHLFKDRTEKIDDPNNEKLHLPISNTIKTEIKKQIDSSISEIFDKY